MNYESSVDCASATLSGVTLVVSKMSFGRRMELARQIRDLAARVEFLAAGNDPREQMEAAVLSSEIERLYVLWGLKEVRGLDLDGAPATPESLVASGPEELFREALAAVKTQCGLSENERKN